METSPGASPPERRRSRRTIREEGRGACWRAREGRRTGQAGGLAVGNTWALGARRSALGARRSALGARRSALGARRSALGARRLIIPPGRTAPVNSSIETYADSMTVPSQVTGNRCGGSWPASDGGVKRRAGVCMGRQGSPCRPCRDRALPARRSDRHRAARTCGRRAGPPARGAGSPLPDPPGRMCAIPVPAILRSRTGSALDIARHRHRSGTPGMASATRRFAKQEAQPLPGWKDICDPWSSNSSRKRPLFGTRCGGRGSTGGGGTSRKTGRARIIVFPRAYRCRFERSPHAA